MPVGLHLTRVAKAIGRAFDDELAAAGGSQSVWLVLLTLKRTQVASQRELADAVGIQGATLTHHLNAMEADGLLTRRRDPDNRRMHLVELTAEGDALFHRLRKAAGRFDELLRGELSENELARLRRTLDRLAANVGTAPSPW
jgi:MarR family transcriptional regulator for hemolysin